ncbi:RBR-type E3 ubiquitin transferase [Entamoeba marina]
MTTKKSITLRKFEKSFEAILIMNGNEQEQSIKKLLEEYRQEHTNPEEEVTCDICYEDFKRKEMCVLPNCGHMLCQDCVKDHFKEKLTSLDAFDEGYPCFEAGCSNKFTLDELSHLNYITKEQYFNTLKFVSKRTIDNDNYVVQCSNTACLNIYVEKKTGCQPTKCPECHKEFCIQCGRVWHPNLTCEEALKKAKDEGLTDEAVAKFTRPCPHCKTRIFKDGGCQWMQCYKCHGFFCWRCMQKSYDHKHFNGAAWGACKEWKVGDPYP